VVLDDCTMPQQPALRLLQHHQQRLEGAGLVVVSIEH